MLQPAIEIRNSGRRLRYDATTKEWILELGGSGNPIVRHRKKDVIENLLDWIENIERGK